MAKYAAVLIAFACLIWASAGLPKPRPNSQSHVDRPYEEALRATAQAINNGTLAERFTVAWRDYRADPKPETAVAAGLASFYLDWLDSVRLAKLPTCGALIPEAGRALKFAMEKERSSAYPTLIYAWFIETNRDPSLRPLPIYKDLGSFQVKGSDGKMHMARQERLIDDPANRRQVRSLIQRAQSIDRQNPLLFYMNARVADSEREAKRSLWGCLGSPGKYLWEYGALCSLRRRAGKDKAELARIDAWVRRSKAVTGPSLLAKGHGF